MDSDATKLQIDTLKQKMEIIEKNIQQMNENITNNLNQLYNNIEKIDAIIDRHSTQIRNQQGFNQQINQVIGKLIENSKKEEPHTHNTRKQLKSIEPTKTKNL